MKTEFYLPRLFDGTLDFAMKTKCVVVVEGPKWCGKSTTCKRHVKEVVDLMPIQTREDLIQEAKIAPHQFLTTRAHPLLIDEWQHVAFLWDQFKYEADQSREFGQYVLTGSVTDRDIDDSFFNKEEKHTGNGRIVRKRMRTMSLFESGESKGIVSLKELQAGVFRPARSKMSIEDYAFAICRGGWPVAVMQKGEVALQQARDYFETVVTDDLFSLKTIHLTKDEGKARKVMRSYARNVSIPASAETLLGDCADGDSSFDKETFYKYLHALDYLFVTDDLPAWNPNVRSKTAIRTKPTRHFVDPSIATSSLGLTPQSLFRNITTFGFLFESLAVRDIRVYAETIGARVYKHRDAKKREADIVVVFPDGSFALIEVKLGGAEDVEEAAAKLTALANDIDTEKTGKLAFLMVITIGNVAYRREQDDVYVVPLGCLRD